MLVLLCQQPNGVHDLETDAVSFGSFARRAQLGDGFVLL